MPTPKIVTQQHISSTMLDRSKQLRRKMTPAESRLWQRLRAGHLEGFHFRRQQVIDHFIVDFFCNKANLVVEVDGGIHLEQVEYDRERDLYLTQRGLMVLRFSNSEVSHQLDSVLTAILEACRRPHNEAEDEI